MLLLALALRTAPFMDRCPAYTLALIAIFS
jgi:hypothetical protein